MTDLEAQDGDITEKSQLKQTEVAKETNDCYTKEELLRKSQFERNIVKNLFRTVRNTVRNAGSNSGFVRTVDLVPTARYSVFEGEREVDSVRVE